VIKPDRQFPYVDPPILYRLIDRGRWQNAGADNWSSHGVYSKETW